MRIAIVYDALYPYISGGAERRNWEIARRLRELGHEVDLIGMQHWPGDMTLEKDGVRYVGVCPAVPLFKPDGSRSVTEPWYFAWHLHRYLKKSTYDIVDCSNFPYLSCLAAWLALRGGKTQIVITWHEVRGLKGWLFYAGKIGALASFFEYLTLFVTGNNIAVSPFTRQRALTTYRYPRISMTVMPNGVSLGDYQHGNPKRPEILFVGRLVQHKRVDTLIRVFARFSIEAPEYSLVIIGSGDREKDLRELADKLGLADKIVFRGRVHSTDLFAQYSNAAVSVLPSEQEGFGMVLVEAMAAGTPVVAWDHEFSAAKFIITDGSNGLLVKSEDQLLEALRRLRNDAGLSDQLIRNGLESARLYDWDETVVPELLYYYESLGLKIYSSPHLGENLRLLAIRGARRLIYNTPARNWALTRWIYRLIGGNASHPESPRILETHGMRLMIEPGQTRMIPSLQSNSYERGSLSVFESILRDELSHQLPSACVEFVDVGAGIGLYTIKALQVLGRRGKVLGIEPDELRRQLLAQSIELNGLSGANLDGEPVSKTSPLASRLLVHGLRPSILRLDVSGFEAEILEGLFPLAPELSSHLRHVLLDFHLGDLRAQGVDPDQLMARLFSWFRSVHWIDEVKAQEIPFQLGDATCRKFLRIGGNLLLKI